MTEIHTPLPWTVSNGCDQYICNGDHWIASTMGIRGEEGAANARFIVQAVNSHHRLVEALRGLLDEIGKSACADTILDSAAAGKAFAAIAEVEGRRG